MQLILMYAGMGLAAIGLLAAFYYYFQLLALVFQENVGWGLGCFLFHVPMLFFVALRWDKAGGAFLRFIGALVAFRLGIALSVGTFHT